jgi:predicted nuclease of predicted toxin-antitoxin system
MKFLADENFNNIILVALLRRRPNIDVVRVQDIGLMGAEDPVILEEAASSDRVLLTHDFATMPRFAWERVGAGLPLPGVLLLREDVEVPSVVDDILIFEDCGVPEDLKDQVRYLPL